MNPESPMQQVVEKTHHLEDVVAAIEPARASRLLFWAIAGFFVITLLWAAFAKIDRTVRGPGRVIPSSELQEVSSLEGGILEAILVRTGEVVKFGQPLLRLDPTESDANLGNTAATARALDMKIARLTAEISGSAPRYPSPANAEAARQLQVERSLYAARQAGLRSLLAAAHAKQSSAREAVAEARGARDAAESALGAAQAELTMIRPLVDRGIEPRLSLVRAENAATTSAGELARTQASLARAQAGRAEAGANLARVTQDWRERAAADLAAAQAEASARRSSLPALKERVHRTVLRSPIDGKVNRVLVATRGSPVSPGLPLIEVVPTRDTLLIEARISPQNIGAVRLGQKARIGISAYDQAVYGALTGKVRTISPDSVVDERTGDIFYLIRLVTDSDALTGPNGQKLVIGPGMVADVALLGDKRTVLQYLLTPLSRLNERAFRE